MDQSSSVTPYIIGPPAPQKPSRLRRVLGPLAPIAILMAKFGKLLLILLKGGKFAATMITMVISIGVYALFWGWPFAVGFVLLLFVHEMGHAIQLRREGVPSSAPLFVPFLGAVIGMKQLPDDAAAEARVGLAGPILGTAGALVCWAAAAEIGTASYAGQLLLALAYTGAFLNLFNLLPVSPLDGGRAMAAVSPWAWLFGLACLLGLFVVMGPNPILLLILIIGGFETIGRFRKRHEQSAYYQVSPRTRMIILAVYIGLVLGLGYMMSQTLVALPK